MNLIAINLGLAPVPPLPAVILERQRSTAEERERCARGERGRKTYGAAYREQMLATLRETGSGTVMDIACYMNTTRHVARSHLERLEREGKVERRQRMAGNRTVAVWHAIEAPNA